MFRKIAIDPGHGGPENGVAWGYTHEDDVNLGIAYLLRCELLHHAFFEYVVLTRERDEFISLSDRVLLANTNQADLFISIHCDAYHNTTVQGISTHVHPAAAEDTVEIADGIQRSLIKMFPDHVSRGTKRSNFQVLRETFMPAILVECEFLTNPQMRRFLREPENQLALARAIAGGVE